MILQRVVSAFVLLFLASGNAMHEEIIPITAAASGHATVPIGLQGLGTFAFVLDTGAEGSAVYKAFATGQKLKPAPEHEVLIGQTGATELPVVMLPPVTLGSLTTESIPAVVLPPRADGVDLTGIIGLDVFGQSLLDFNFPGRRVGLLPTGSRPPELRDEAPLPTARTRGDLLTVSITLNGIEAVAVIDTGARKTRINWVLGRQLGLNPGSVSVGDVIQGATNTPLESARAFIHTVDIGNRKLSNIPVFVADLPVFEAFGVDQQPALILGLDWLEKMRMVIDFPEQKVWFLAPG